MSLEQLAVVSAPQITFDTKYPDRITVEFTPTVPHCGMSTFIGECSVDPCDVYQSIFRSGTGLERTEIDI